MRHIAFLPAAFEDFVWWAKRTQKPTNVSLD